MLSNVRIKNSNNIGYLIQPYKIKELVEEPIEKREEINKQYEENANLDLTLSVETTIFKHNYSNPNEVYEQIAERKLNRENNKDITRTKTIEENIKLFDEFEDKSLDNKQQDENEEVDVDLTKTFEAAIDVGKIYSKKEKKEKDNTPVTKESVDKKIAEMEKLDLDSILNTDDFKIWRKNKK